MSLCAFCGYPTEDPGSVPSTPAPPQGIERVLYTTDAVVEGGRAGYAACFHSGLLSVAQGRKLDASDSTVTVHVGIGPTGRGGFGLAVALDLHAPNLSRVDAEDLMRRAHALCPHSNATRGNVDVTLRVDGKAINERGIPMKDDKIYLLTESTVLPECLEEVKAILNEALVPTVEEPGCEALDETGREDDPHKLVFFEVFSAAAAHEFHTDPMSAL